MSNLRNPNKKLRQQRELRGWSQRKVADAIGTDEKRVSAWERGESVPSSYYQEKLCSLFGKNTLELGLKKHVGNLATKHPPVKEANESFSFGSIQTTGVVLDGDGTSEYALENIHTHFTLRSEKLPEELQARRDQIQQEQEQKKAQGLSYHWNGEIYNLDRFVISREPIYEHMMLDLWFSPSDYYTFLATNMSLKDPAIREKYLSDVDWYETVPYFSHSFGTSLVVITLDGYTFLTQRSPRQGSDAGYYSISANEGMSRGLDRATNIDIPDLYRCACRGLTEELGLYEPVDFSVSDITFLSFEVDTQYALWGILGMIKIKKTIAQVLKRWQRVAKDKMENKKVFPVPFTPQDICTFVFSHENWTPGGLICLYHTLVHEFGREEVDSIISLEEVFNADKEGRF